MRATLLLAAPLLLLACGTEEPTAPVTDAAALPAFAAERTTVTTTFTLREQNPCNLEPVTFQVTFTLRQIVAGPDGSLVRVGTVSRFTGIGDFGTSYTGQEHTNVVFHLDPDGSWGTSGRVTNIRGSVSGTSFQLVSRSIIVRETGEIREVVSRTECK